MWYIHDGNENVVQKQGASITHAFALTSEKMGYPVVVEMYLKGSSKPFIAYQSVDVEGDAFVPVIRWDTQPGSDPNIITFTAQSSTGRNIDWTQAKWTFGDSSEAQYGATAVHKYPVSSTTQTYRVSLTLTRRSGSGQYETRTTIQTVTLGADEITPVIRAEYHEAEGMLYLSAEESTGRGLLLDRAVWLFEGEGDSENLTINKRDGVIYNNSAYYDVGARVDYGMPKLFNVSGLDIKAWAIGGDRGSWDYINSNDYRENSQTFSSSNMQTGAVCRRYVKEYDTKKGEWNVDNYILVTFIVTRMDASGGVEAKSITVNINLKAARITKANSRGVAYGKLQ